MKKIAVTSQNFKTVTGHAGKARRFIIFGVDKKGGVEQLEQLDLPKEMAMHSTLESSPHPLDEVDYLISQGGGEGFIRKMAVRGIDVVLTSASDPLLCAMSLAAGEQLPPVSLGDEHDNEAVGCGCSCGH